jgi:hypothetical protein
MTGISMVFLVVFLVVKRPTQTQIRRKTHRIKKKHQDKVQVPKDKKTPKK